MNQTLAYDRCDRERTMIDLDDLIAEKEALQILLDHADTDEVHERIALCLDQCSDAIGVLRSRLHETEYEIGLRGGEWR